MACRTDRSARCGPAPLLLPDGLARAVAALGAIGSTIAIILIVFRLAGIVPTAAGGTVLIGGSAVSVAGLGGAIAGFAAWLAMSAVMIGYAMERCFRGEVSRHCAAGVVAGIVGSFSSAWEHIFPFTANHDRVDLVAKSRFWDLIESGGAFVFCTDDPAPRQSEILRCYFYDAQVCAVIAAAVPVAVTAGAVGVFVGIIAAAAIGCATIILCLLALIVAVLIVVFLMLLSAFIAGQMARIAGRDPSPTSSRGETLTVGHLLSLDGDMRRRDYDDTANVFHWVVRARLLGTSTSPRPFSYCEIDDELVIDNCP